MKNSQQQNYERTAQNINFPILDNYLFFYRSLAHKIGIKHDNLGIIYTLYTFKKSYILHGLLHLTNKNWVRVLTKMANKFHTPQP